MKVRIKKIEVLCALCLLVILVISNILFLLPLNAAYQEATYDWIEVDPGIFHCEESSDSHCSPRSTYWFFSL